MSRQPFITVHAVAVVPGNDTIDCLTIMTQNIQHEHCTCFVMLWHASQHALVKKNDPSAMHVNSGVQSTM